MGLRGALDKVKVQIHLGAQTVKNLLAMRGHGFDPWVRKAPAEENGHPVQYSCLENPMPRGAWWATVDGVTKSQT